jgi:methionine-S-sulfoxide reductase
MRKEKAILAGGCFWGVEELIRSIPGVLSTEVGYTGGHHANPDYKLICTGETGHAEAIAIDFDSEILSFETLLKDWFFKLHDPTTLNRQGNDIGSQYRSAIFYVDEKQRETAKKIIADPDLASFWKNPIVTELTKATEFYSAEAYHQDYLQKNPQGYTCHYLRR